MLTEQITNLANQLPISVWKFHFIKGRFYSGDNLVSFYQTINQAGEFKLHFEFFNYRTFKLVSQQNFEISFQDLKSEHKDYLLHKIETQISAIISGDHETKLDVSKSTTLSRIIDEIKLPVQFSNEIVEI